MEIPKPMTVYISVGLRFTIYLFINDIYYKQLDYKSIMNKAVDDGHSVGIIKNEWQVINARPIITNLYFVVSIQQTEMQIIPSDSSEKRGAEFINKLFDLYFLCLRSFL